MSRNEDHSIERLRAIIDAKDRQIADLNVRLKLAQRDELTGLPRRAELVEDAQRSINNRQLPTSMIFMDLNGFKNINDTIGHSGGDSLIIQVGEFLKKQKNLLGEDGLLVTLSRLGGDEFAILLPYTSHDEAIGLIAVIKANLKEEVFALGDDHTFQICAAMGSATTEDSDCSTVAALLHRADQAMYKDKASMKEAGETTKKVV